MTLQLTNLYRVDSNPPHACSLQPGELFVQIGILTGIPPRLWVGTLPGHGFAGNTALLVSNVALPAPSTITINAVTNPSPNNQVRISGTAAPGCRVEIAILQGLDQDHFNQLTEWSPFDATAGAFDVTWFVPTADNCRARVRMLDDPHTWADSNIFAVNAPPLARP